MATVTQRLKQWRYLKVGGGGFMMRFSQHSDGTMIAGGDVYGLFKLDTTNPATGKWSAIFRSDNVENYGHLDAIVDTQAAPYDCKIAPSNSQIMYAVYALCASNSTTSRPVVFKSINGGTSWTQQSSISSGPFSTMTFANMPSNGGGRQAQDKLWVDPLDPTHLLLGDRIVGLHRSTDSGATWAQCTDVLAPTGNSGEHGVCAIRHSPTSGSTSGRTSTIYCNSFGRGYYRSTDAGVTWTLLSGSPTTAYDNVFSTDGSYLYSVSQNNNILYRYSVGADTWTNITPGVDGQGTASVDFDPNNSSRLCLFTEGGTVIETTTPTTATTSTGWGGHVFLTDITMSSDLIPWQVMAQDYKTTSVIKFSKTVANQLIFMQGIGCWYCDFPVGASTLTWTSFTDETDLLIATNILSTKTNGTLYLTAWDRPLWKIADPWNYPSEYVPASARISGSPAQSNLAHAFMLDYAKSDPNYIVSTTIPFGGGDGRGYVSSDNGVNWTEPTSFLTAAANFDNQNNRYMGGCVAVSTPTNSVIFMANNNRPRYTTDGWATWGICSFAAPMVAWDGTGTPTAQTTAAGFYGSSTSIRRIVAVADTVTANKFYAVHPYWGSWVSTDSGANWTQTEAASAMGYLDTSTSALYSKLRAVPGNAGHLFYTAGSTAGQTASTSRPAARSFWKTTNGTTSWTAVPDVKEVVDFGFGPIAPGATYPTIWIAGWVNNGTSYVYGIYYSTDNCSTWYQVAEHPFMNRMDQMLNLAPDAVVHEQCYVGFGNSGWGFTEGAPASRTRFRATTV